VLCGTDYVYPRTTNTILYKYLTESLGVPDSDILTIYTPFGHSDWSALVDKIVDFAAAGEAVGKPACVVSTLNGDVNTFFYREIARRVR
jgi:urea transport system substrate-binding protein